MTHNIIRLGVVALGAKMVWAPSASARCANPFVYKSRPTFERPGEIDTEGTVVRLLEYRTDYVIVGKIVEVKPLPPRQWFPTTQTMGPRFFSAKLAIETTVRGNVTGVVPIIAVYEAITDTGAMPATDKLADAMMELSKGRQLLFLSRFRADEFAKANLATQETGQTDPYMRRQVLTAAQVASIQAFAPIAQFGLGGDCGHSSFPLPDTLSGEVIAAMEKSRASSQSKPN